MVLLRAKKFSIYPVYYNEKLALFSKSAIVEKVVTLLIIACH